MYRYFLYFTLLLPLTTTAQTPIARIGDSCPTGTYKSADYCKRISSSDREALPRGSGLDHTGKEGVSPLSGQALKIRAGCRIWSGWIKAS